MKKLKDLFNRKKNLLSVYFTAGFPNIESTTKVLKSLEKAGVDFVEIGMPYSDPLADGPVIQNSSTRALENGMNLNTLFGQLATISDKISMPMILMGYLNPVLKYGPEKFIEQCKKNNISGLILPDLPYETYLEEYQDLFTASGISNIFLITPQTPEERVRKLDSASTSFIYMVSSAAVTGARDGLSAQQIEYFERINGLNLMNPRMVGFGISNNQTYKDVCRYAHGAIVGSAFIKHLEQSGDDVQGIIDFIKELKEG